MKNNDQDLLIEAYSKVGLQKESEGMGYPTNWDKGFKSPMKIASGGDEVPYMKDNKWYILTYNSETGEHEVYSYSEDTYYPEDTDGDDDDQSGHDDMDDSMDGDFDSGMASAGHGTDEDYGGGDERY